MTRYGIGQDAENGELLIEDHKTHSLIARAGEMALPRLRELIEAANRTTDKPTWIPRPTHAGWWWRWWAGSNGHPVIVLVDIPSKFYWKDSQWQPITTPEPPENNDAR